MQPTERDIERFTDGSCHVLARAVQLLTWWPIRSFADWEYPDAHAWVAPSRGMALDVLGLRPERELVKDWRAMHPALRKQRVRTFTWGEILQCWGNDWKGTGAKERARILAPHLVELAACSR